MEKQSVELRITQALQGDNDALADVLLEVQDLIFNLSLRMLGSVADAEDATQDILVRIMTHLSSYKGRAAFQTWVYRIASNYLISYKKSMFAKHPLNFDFYADDIKNGIAHSEYDIVEDMTREKLAEELKLSCTNVMLQCFDAETRCIFILGTMFKVDSKMAGEILEITPENYRQRLSRARKKMSEFLSMYCGLTDTGQCSCKRRVEYAIQQHRLHPLHLEYGALSILPKGKLMEVKTSMEELDALTTIFDTLPNYKTTTTAKSFIEQLLQTDCMEKIKI